MSTSPPAPSTTLRRALTVAVDHPAFAGHFPGQPILPGVALLALVLEAARAEPPLITAIGTLLHVPAVKFLAVVRPGAALEIEFRLGPRALDWQVSEAGVTVANGRIQRSDGRGDDGAAPARTSP
ncbi:MAG: 3-hydroxyacyl-ACP dehydratase [Caldimonas sp.]